MALLLTYELATAWQPPKLASTQNTSWAMGMTDDPLVPYTTWHRRIPNALSSPPLPLLGTLPLTVISSPQHTSNNWPLRWLSVPWPGLQSSQVHQAWTKIRSQKIGQQARILYSLVSAALSHCIHLTHHGEHENSFLLAVRLLQVLPFRLYHNNLLGFKALVYLSQVLVVVDSVSSAPLLATKTNFTPKFASSVVCGGLSSLYEIIT